MKQEKYSYPCVITFDRSDDVFYVEFPDLEECFTDGKNLEEALYNAQDVLGLVLYEREKRRVPIPSPKMSFMHTKEDQLLSIVSVWMPLVRNQIEQRSVKKTLTIPKWLNDMAEEKDVNFSGLLQASLKEYLGVVQEK